jgi:hypothetical protein
MLYNCSLNLFLRPNVQDKPLNIAGRIRAARRRAQMDPAALRAQLREYGIDLSKTGLHRLETTEPKNPNLKIVEAIAEITNVSPGWILFGKGPTVPDTEVGSAIRSRVIDTIEMMSGALDLTARQESTLSNWLKSVRETRPKRIKKP